MRKFLCLIFAVLLAFSFVSCDSNSTNEDSCFESINIDYNDATSFEKALNDGVNVKGKTVRFYVKEYVPDSVLGINCYAGEHLNFIFEEELDVKNGSTMIVRVAEEPTKLLLIGSWKVPCEFLLIETEASSESTVENETVTSVVSKTSNENKESKTEEIVLTMSEDDFKGMSYKKAEKKLREMGFTKFEYETVDNKDKSSEDKICYIEITEFLFGNSDFEKGDKFEVDSTVTLYFYKYNAPTKPQPVFYSTNDYETAQKGNTGVFSYKNQTGSYDIYWIIDFNKGYVYNFTDGNGEATCYKLKIVDGDLNNRITVTWHDSGEQRSWYLHFKYKNRPATLVVNDHNNDAIEFTTTDLDDALSVRKTKTIKEY